MMLSGTWTDGKFGFKGKWVWQDNVYKGGFKEGYFFGRGKFKWSTGESLLADFDTDCPSRGCLTLISPKYAFNDVCHRSQRKYSRRNQDGGGRLGAE